MIPSSRSVRGLTALVALLVTLLGAALAYWVLDPSIGIDDANITQVYARNLAAGHGYVYNVGGERVEGSTSLFWTLINAAAFRVSSMPEMGLAGLCAVMTWVTIFAAMRVAGGLTTDATANGGCMPALLTGAAFLAFPAFFGWMVWSLMDVTLWVMVIALTVWILQRIELTGARARLFLGLAVLAALLPVTRPEGVVLTTALAGFYILRRLLFGAPGLLVGLIVGLAGAASFAAATAWRLSYFGYPFPNTYYAKTSTDLVAQVIRGAEYILAYFQEPQNVLLFVSFCISGALLLARGGGAGRAAFWLAAYVILGGAALYAVLGGDHFGSHRFFVYFVPLALPVIVAALAGVALEAPGVRHGPALLMVAAFLVAGGASVARFLQMNGHLLIEFAIAEEGRDLGRGLNALPGAPVVGVITAGGIRMTYEGEVQDLMGLNWTVVAHAPDDAVNANITNHTGFNTDTFWGQSPEVMPRFPVVAGCPGSWQPLEGFLDQVTDGITRTEAFRETYDLYCFGNGAIYVSRDWAAGQDLPGAPLPDATGG